MSSGSPRRLSGVRTMRSAARAVSSPERAREIRSHEAGRDGVDPDVVRPELDREIAHELEVGGLGDAIGPDHVGADLAADRGDVDDRAVLPRPHLVCDQLREPEVGLHVGRHDLGEGVIGDLGERAVVRVDGGVADDDVDAPPGSAGFLDQAFELGLAPHVAGEAEDRESLVGELPLCRLDPSFVPAGDDHACAVLGERPCDGLADPLGGAGDDGGLAGEVEEARTWRSAASRVYGNRAVMAYPRRLDVARRRGAAEDDAPYRQSRRNDRFRGGLLPADARAR